MKIIFKEQSIILLSGCRGAGDNAGVPGDCQATGDNDWVAVGVIRYHTKALYKALIQYLYIVVKYYIITEIIRS